jgi:predicted GIY-YIG superfamily endonuclease
MRAPYFLVKSAATGQSGTAMNQLYFVYILTTRQHTVLYTGVTNNLSRRVFEHREKLIAGFTTRDHVSKLLYYQATNEMRAGEADQGRLTREETRIDHGDEPELAGFV